MRLTRVTNKANMVLMTTNETELLPDYDADDTVGVYDANGRFRASFVSRDEASDWISVNCDERKGDFSICPLRTVRS